MAVDRKEQEKADEREALSAKAVHRALLQEGENELSRTSSSLAWSGLAAGISIGLSLIAQGVLLSRLPDSEWRLLVTSLGYPVGFIAVTLGRQQLFTETTLTAMLPLLHYGTGAANVVRLWIVVLAANLAGASIFAAASAFTTTFSQELSSAMVEIGLEQVRYPFTTAFVKGIFGGWMIALMVWLMPAAHGSRLLVIAVITWLLSAGEFTHVIAGSADVLFAVMKGEVGIGAFVFSFLIPVLLGNSVGGIVFVAALNHAQVVND